MTCYEAVNKYKHIKDYLGWIMCFTNPKQNKRKIDQRGIEEIYRKSEDILKSLDELKESSDKSEEILSKERNDLASLANSYRYIIRNVHCLRVNLYELDRLGLHKYNAKYGKRISEHLTTNVPDRLYSELIKYSFISGPRQSGPERK